VDLEEVEAWHPAQAQCVWRSESISAGKHCGCQTDKTREREIMLVGKQTGKWPDDCDCHEKDSSSRILGVQMPLIRGVTKQDRVRATAR